MTPTPEQLETVRELTYEERSQWGKCPVCEAPHGEPCRPEIGIHLGMTVSGKPTKDGVHLGRLQRAPTRERKTYEA